MLFYIPHCVGGVNVREIYYASKPWGQHMRSLNLAAVSGFFILLILLLLATSLTRTDAWAANFSSIKGVWRGSGQLKLQDGRFENLRCRAYYTPRNNGSFLGMAVRCASTSYKFEFRSKLKLDGKSVKGSWEERNFNVEGKVSGTFQPGKITLATTGAVDAGLYVIYDDKKQSVDLTGDFGNFRGISLSFSK
ncbi:MAG: hypothetical protein TECD_00616 [Hyphomicrobiaceae bacterium hypho_1]